MTRILVLGVTGMLGHSLLRELSSVERLEVFGTARSSGALEPGPQQHAVEWVHIGMDGSPMAVDEVLERVEPEIVVNCIGVIKQNEAAGDPVATVALNSLFPHVLAHACSRRSARLIHISTDCVFSGARGNYRETDVPDASDLYGRSKLLGETTTPPALTLRTSIIGHELHTNRSLIDWFLAQSGTVNGYRHSIYSGVTTIEFAKLLASTVFPRPDLMGLYHVAGQPISKYDLLRNVADVYQWPGNLQPYDDFKCDRSLCADAFFGATGYRPPSWRDMIEQMHTVAIRARTRD